MRVRCTEVSPEFTDSPFDEEEDAKVSNDYAPIDPRHPASTVFLYLQFYADLYQLAMNTAGIKTRISIQRISFKLVSTVARLLERTNVIGMSS